MRLSLIVNATLPAAPAVTGNAATRPSARPAAVTARNVRGLRIALVSLSSGAAGPVLPGGSVRPNSVRRRFDGRRCATRDQSPLGGTHQRRHDDEQHQAHQDPGHDDTAGPGVHPSRIGGPPRPGPTVEGWPGCARTPWAWPRSAGSPAPPGRGRTTSGRSLGGLSGTGRRYAYGT